MYPPTFPQTAHNIPTPFPIGGNGTSGSLPWQGNPALYGNVQNPYAQGGQSFAPQGILGSLLGSTAGRLIGNLAGQGNIGRIVGGAAGSFLPFQAGPQEQQYQQPGQQYQQGPDFDPMGLGSFFRKVVSIIPDAVKVAATVAKVLPQQAGPQLSQQSFAPQGWGGDLLGQLAQTAGGHIGGPWGEAIQGAGPLLSHLAPFQAGPQGQQYQQYQRPGQQYQQGSDFDPQGFGSFFKKMVSIIPDAVNVATTVAKVLPLQAGPQQQQQQQQLQQFDPQGLWSSLGQLAGHLPDLAKAAQQIGLLQAGPQLAPPGFSPQGWGGDLLGKLAQTAGGQIPGPWGQLIQSTGPVISQLAPFHAGPQGQYQQPGPADFDPQGFGSFFKKMVAIIPDAVKVATTVAKVLPLQAGPQLSPQSLFQSPFQSPYSPTVPTWPYLGFSPYAQTGQA